ncbi:MAG: precorrin-3B C(17)-methyltransferase, partial [Nitrosopumilaceae archaeon]
MTGKLYIVGVGPGHHDHMTFRAKQVIEESDTIVGYETYVDLVADLIEGKDVYRYAMTQEVERARQCIELAESGRIVSLVSSGDPGIYGMAGLIYEILAESGWDRNNGLCVELVPGVSSLNSCAALVGSPLMTDFAVVSMSDLLVPWEIIVKRVEAAAQGDFVIVIYNPSSKKRIHQLQDTRKILLKYRSPTTPVAIVKGAYRESQTIVLTDLENLENHSDKLGMISTVIIGNSSTYMYKDIM